MGWGRGCWSGAGAGSTGVNFLVIWTRSFFVVTIIPSKGCFRRIWLRKALQHGVNNVTCSNGEECIHPTLPMSMLVCRLHEDKEYFVVSEILSALGTPKGSVVVSAWLDSETPPQWVAHCPYPWRDRWAGSCGEECTLYISLWLVKLKHKKICVVCSLRWNRPATDLFRTFHAGGISMCVTISWWNLPSSFLATH